MSVYYQHTGQLPLASKLSLLARRRMFEIFMEYFRPGPATSVLDVGVTSDASFAESNYFERLYPYPHRIVCVGTEDGSHLTQLYPGLRYLQVTPGQPLPFKAGDFDIVFSNAVLEHVGGTENQRAFIGELCRVASGFFITTPNRWFPVEPHTGVPLLHYSPRLFRSLARKTRFRYWAEEANLNLLSAGDLNRLFPSEAKPTIVKVRLAGVASNLVAVGRVAAGRP